MNEAVGAKGAEGGGESLDVVEASSFARRRSLETLCSLWPLRGQLGLSRTEVDGLVKRVAKRPLESSTRWLQMDSWPELELDGREQLVAASADGRGVIVVPAHFGVYQWTPIALLNAGLSVSLLVDRRNRDFFSTDVRDRIAPMYAGQGMFADRGHASFDTIDSESPTSLWRLSKALSNGRAGVMFVDGNSGVDGRLDPRGAVRVPLLGREVWVRPGIAVLAQLAGAAIVPVATSFDAARGRARFEFAPALAPAEGEPRQAGRARIMAALFAWLESQIRARPDEWEEWWLLRGWWVDAPVAGPRPPTPDSLELPALVGRSLRPGGDWLWCVDLPEGPAVVDLAGSRVLTTAPELVDLFRASERGASVLRWIREQDDREQARQLLARALRLGLVGL